MPPGLILFETGSDPELFSIKHLSVKGNIGFAALFQLREATSTAADKNGPVGAHTWVVEDVREQYRRRNLLALQQRDPAAWPNTRGACTVKTEVNKQQHDGVPILTVHAPPPAPAAPIQSHVRGDDSASEGCTMTMLTLDLTEAGLQPELRGAVVRVWSLEPTKEHLRAVAAYVCAGESIQRRVYSR